MRQWLINLSFSNPIMFYVVMTVILILLIIVVFKNPLIKKLDKMAYKNLLKNLKEAEKELEDEERQGKQ